MSNINLPLIDKKHNTNIGFVDVSVKCNKESIYNDKNNMLLKTSRELVFKKKVGCFGIEIYNFDVDNTNHTNTLQKLLDEYLVIIIKRTYISRKEQLKLAKVFGEPTLAHPVVQGNDEFPQILELDGENGGKNAKWHTDVSFLENPHSVSVLFGDEVPDNGGDTLWCDHRTAYENISTEMKKLINNLEAVHKITPLAYWGEPFDKTASPEKILQLYEDSKKITPVIHPIVRIHPKTQKPAIFVNPGFTSHILNLSKIESDNILQLLYNHTTQPEYILRHKWEKDDIIIWDNTCTSHYAVNDYGSETRKMRRVTVKGEIPIGYNNIKSRKTEDPKHLFPFTNDLHCD
jgi:alpha-ketoglutarate-dependent taurine dioxygenase